MTRLTFFSCFRVLLSLSTLFATQVTISLAAGGGDFQNIKPKPGTQNPFLLQNTSPPPPPFPISTAPPPFLKSPFDEVYLLENKSLSPFPVDLLKDDKGSMKFLWDIFNLVLKKGIFFTSGDEVKKSPFNFQPKEQLRKMMDMSVSSSGDSYDSMLKSLESTIAQSPHRAHPFYLRRDAAGLDPYAVAGDLIAAALKAMVEEEGEASPALALALIALFFLMQMQTVVQLRLLIGYTFGDGLMTISTASANGMALQYALTTKFPASVAKGLLNFELPKGATIFVSEGQDEIVKSLNVGGLPLTNVVKVRMDKNGRMDPNDLEQKVMNAKKENKNPFMVIISLGTYSLGVIDPLSVVVQIAEKYDLWVHVDGSYGGPSLFSKEQKIRLKGIERTNSFTWSSSSMLGVPYESSFLLIRNDGLLSSVWNLESAQTFVTTHAFTMAQHFMQGPKLEDVMRTWFMWLVKGNRGLGQHVDYSFNMTKTLIEKIKKRSPNFKLCVDHVDTPVVAFNYIPDSLLNQSTKSDLFYNTKLTAFTELLKFNLLVEGFIYISTARSRADEPKYFIISLSNSIITPPDLDYVLDKIDCFGQRISKLKPDLCLKSTIQRFIRSPLASSVSDYAPYVNAALPDLHLPFIKGFFELVMKKLFKLSKGPSEWKKVSLTDEAADSSNKMADLGLAEFGLKQKDILPYVEEIFDFIANASKVSGQGINFAKKFTPINLIGDLFLSSMSPSMVSYDASPPFAIIQDELISTIRQRIKYPAKNGDSSGDGIIIPTSGNMPLLYAIAMSKIKVANNSSKQLVFYTSEQNRYVNEKLVLGSEKCVYVKTDEKSGRIKTADLKSSIEVSLAAGHQPFLVVANIGTMVFGSIDPIKEIADLCKQFGLWLHIDGAIGGSLIFSENQRAVLKGIEQSDSFAFRPHKLFGSALQSFSVFVTRNFSIGNIATQEKSSNTSDPDKFAGGDSYNLAGKRRPEEFKFWLKLKLEGLTRLGKSIDDVLENAKYASRVMKDKYPGRFKQIYPQFDVNILCFVYAPQKYGSIEFDSVKLGETQAKLESILAKNGFGNIIAYINSTGSSSGNGTMEKISAGFLKLDIITADQKEMEVIIETIDKYGRDL